MASLIIRKLVATTPYAVDDLGFSIVGGANTDFDLIHEEAENVSLSTDLTAGITAGDLIVLDPRDNTTPLSVADSILAIQNANLTHFGISGGRFSELDDPSGYTPTDQHVLNFNATSGKYEQIDPTVVISDNQEIVSSIVGGIISDGNDTSVTYDPSVTPTIAGQDETNYDGTEPNGSFVGGDGIIGDPYAPGDTITMSDGSVITVDAVDGNGDVTQFTVTTVGTNVTPGVAVTQVSTSGSGNAFEITPENPNIQQGSVIVDVNDSYLRNDGDTLDSGTLTVASGASINIATGGDLTITDPPVNPTDATNKAYVDSVAQGLDAKESVQAGTAAAFTMGAAAGEWVYADNGGVGDTLTNNTASTTTIDGVLLEDGDRVLIKDQTDPTQNGIYTVSGAAVGSATTFTRALDQDGSPSSEVSAGNFTYVENGTTNGSTGWVTQGDGQLALNTDDIDWVQFSGAGSYTAGPGLDQTGTEFKLDISTLTTDSITTADELAFSDSSATDDNKITVANFLADLNIVTSTGVGGFSVETSTDTYTNRTLQINGGGPLDGLSLVNGDGISGDPTFGLDIQNLPVRPIVDAVDRIPVWDSSTNTNVYYTIQDISDATATTESFKTWTGGGNTSGDADIVADDPDDQVFLIGGNGINIDFTNATDTVTFSFTNDGMVGTNAVVLADTVPFFDASNGDEAEFRSWTNIITDLGIATNITASTDEDELGIVITGLDTVGLDIVGLTDATEDMSATDEFPVHNKSEGTAGANRKITGQDIADGVENILNIGGITISTITGQPILTILDTTRSKQLSVSETAFTWGENRLSNLDWMQIGGNATDADSGFTMPLQGTVVFASGQCENANGNTKDLHLFINGTDQGSIGTITGASEQTFTNTTLDLDFAAGDKLRVRAVGAGTGDVEDTVAAVFVKWRA